MRKPERKLKITEQPLGALQPYANNARTHSKKQIRQIADSIEAFGWTNPVLIDSENSIIAGHGRVQAAKLLGLDKVPTIQIDDLSDEERRAYILADNKLAENAGWDSEILTIELQHLLEVDFDVTITGFATGEIDVLVIDQDEKDAEDEYPPEEPAGDPVSIPGDLWVLGRHRLLCGDARDQSHFQALMNGKLAQTVFTDPPYNVRINHHVCGGGAIKHRDFAMASGEMTSSEYAAFLTTVFENLVHHSCDGSVHYITIDWRHIEEVMRAGRATYNTQLNLCVWSKDNGGLGSLYRSQHELVFVFKSGTAPHINNVELGKHGRNRTNVWEYPGVNSFRPGRLDDLAMHPTVKPIALVADAILDCSRRNGLVLDCFAGSGTTIIAAEKTGRRARAMEVDPGYVDAAIRRWQRLTGETARHVKTGLGLEELRSHRSVNAAPETADV